MKAPPQVADVLEAMEADAGLWTTELHAGGGVAANDFLLQVQALRAGWAKDLEHTKDWTPPDTDATG